MDRNNWDLRFDYGALMHNGKLLKSNVRLNSTAGDYLLLSIITIGVRV